MNKTKMAENNLAATGKGKRYYDCCIWVNERGEARILNQMAAIGCKLVE